MNSMGNEPKVVARLMFAGDLHKRMKDKSTIRGYCKACTEVQKDLINYITANKVTHFFSLGDWFDGGYGSDVAAALVHTDIDKQMNERLHGRLYGLIGNHIRLQMDSNPELFLIQPHPYYKSSMEVNRSSQIIKTPEHLDITIPNEDGSEKIALEIELKHWNPVAENVRDYRIDDSCWNSQDSFKVALYHTEMVIPRQLLFDMNMAYEISNEDIISNVLGKTDLAIVGHIHKAIGKHVIKGLEKDCMMIVPGSLTNVDSGKNTRHEYVDIPMIDVMSDGTVKLYEHRQTLHLDMITFYVKNQMDEETKAKLKSLNGNTMETLYGDYETNVFIGENTSFMSLNKFFEVQGYTQKDKDMLKSIIKNPDDINSLVGIYFKDESEGL